MNYYKLSNLEIAEIFLRALCDKRPETIDALFIHGSINNPQIDTALFREAAEVWHNGRCGHIVVNSLSNKNKPGCLYSYDHYPGKLQKLGVPQERILFIPPSENTALESENFLKLAKKMSWHSLAIESMPYHQPRCFLQIVASMKELNIQPKVYNITFHSVDWNMFVRRKVLGGQNVLGQKDESGPFIGLMKNELERIKKYAVPSSDHIAISSVKDALEYLENRDK